MDQQVDTRTTATSTLNTRKNGNEYQKKNSMGTVGGELLREKTSIRKFLAALTKQDSCPSWAGRVSKLTRHGGWMF